MSAVLTTSSIIKDQSIYYYIYIMHLADAFIQSDLQCIQAIHLFCQYVYSLGIEPTTFALLTQCSNHWATETLLLLLTLRWIVDYRGNNTCIWLCVGVCACVCGCVCVCVCVYPNWNVFRTSPVYLITAWFLGNQPARVVEDCSVCACADARREKSPRALYIPRAAASSVQ